MVEPRKQKFRIIILCYPVALIVIGVLMNLYLFSVSPAVISLPQQPVFAALVISGLLLLLNHTWLMNSTELTRLRYDMYATPEEWDANSRSRDDVPPEGVGELERRHGAHRNATENSVYFVFFALLLSAASPSTLAAQAWMLGFAAGRLGHTYGYLSGRDGLRGLAMSISLISLYGMCSYLVLALLF